jgi:hypothetical protein
MQKNTVWAGNARTAAAGRIGDPWKDLGRNFEVNMETGKASVGAGD